MANKVVGRLKAVLGLDTKKFNKGLKESKKKTSSFGKNINKIGGLIAGAFAVGKIVSFGKAIVNTTAQFQKFNAVLTKTLGSKGAARRAMNDIVNFASETPFQVEELTDAFVKMANRGMKPSIDEMRSLGDLAAATGKTFDQLAEASLDAVVGEFERLKEFGIKARREGENVNFTFKGQTTTVKNTEKAIKNYIISLGNAQGVQGSMNAISKTTGGRISNMKDQWTQLLNTLGSRSTGVINGVIKSLSNMIEMFNMAAKSIQQVKQEALDKSTRKAIEGDKKEVKDLAQRYKELGISVEGMTYKQKAARDLLQQYRDLLESLGPKEKGRKDQILAQIDALENVTKSEKKANDNRKNSAKTVGWYKDKVEQLKGSLDNLLPSQIAEAKQINKKIALYKELIKKIEEAGKAREFSKGFQQGAKMDKAGSKTGISVPDSGIDTEKQLANLDRVIERNQKLQQQMQQNGQQANIMGSLVSQAFQGMANSLQRALEQGENILDSFWQFFKNMLLSLIIKLAAAAAIAAILAALLGGTTLAGNFGMSKGAGFGKNFGSALGGMFGMAGGGIVPGGFPNDTYPALLSSGERVIPPKKLDMGANRGYIAETSIDMRKLNIKLKENQQNSGRFE